METTRAFEIWWAETHITSTSPLIVEAFKEIAWKDWQAGEKHCADSSRFGA
jgi:hypothetical protein